MTNSTGGQYGWGQPPNWQRPGPTPQSPPAPASWGQPSHPLPPPTSQWPAAGAPPPPWVGPTPPPRPPRNRAALIIGAVIIVIVVATTASIVITHRSARHGQVAASAAATTTTSAPPGGTYRIVPTDALKPLVAQIQRITLLSLKPIGDIDTGIGSDIATTPATCTLTDDPTTQKGWGAAISLAQQYFTDGDDKNFNNSSYDALAVFNSDSAAADSLKAVAASVTACPNFIAPPTASEKKDKPWSVSDTHSTDTDMTWMSTRTDNPTWRCGRDYRVVKNLAISTLICGQNPADSPTKLADFIADTATKQP